jgi:KDO2-lipid IV(A) lauroyltransferase
MSAPEPSLAHRSEAKLLHGLIRLLALLPPVAASKLGGAVAGSIGPFLPVTRKVGDANLRLAMPELSTQERKTILRQVWRNLGQTIAELVCLRALRESPRDSLKPGYVVEGWDEYVAPHLVRGQPALFFTGHTANWEVMPLIAATKNVNFGFMYRAPSNRLVDEMLGRLRQEGYDSPVQMFAKGAAGARAAYAHVRNGGALGFLVDQKLDTGLAVPFFGKPAMTMDALASFALRLRCPVFPIHVKRLGPARLHVVCEPPIPLPESNDRAADTLALTVEVNRIVEGWVRQAPGDWLWLHRRWPKGTV